MRSLHKAGCLGLAVVLLSHGVAQAWPKLPALHRPIPVPTPQPPTAAEVAATSRIAAVFAPALADKAENVLMVRKMPISQVGDLVKLGGFHSDKLTAALKNGHFLQVFEVITAIKQCSKMAGYLSPIASVDPAAKDKAGAADAIAADPNAFDPQDNTVWVMAVRSDMDAPLPDRDTMFVDVVDAKNGIVAVAPDNLLKLDGQNFFDDLRTIYSSDGSDPKLPAAMKTDAGAAVLKILMKPGAAPANPAPATLEIEPVASPTAAPFFKSTPMATPISEPAGTPIHTPVPKPTPKPARTAAFHFDGPIRVPMGDDR